MKKQAPNYFDFVEDIEFQSILTNPILDIGAHFWEDDRYEAFKICYMSMRVIDDMVDDCKASQENIAQTDKQELISEVNEWIQTLARSIDDGDETNLFAKTISTFNLPLWPWEKLSTAMIYDVNHNGFESLQTFLNYSEGAAVSPGSIFMHLCGVEKEDGVYRPPRFEIMDAARPLAIFSYLTHIFRDFQKDQMENLNYFAKDLIEESGLNSTMLRDIASGGEIPQGFRDLMEKYYSIATEYQTMARQKLDKIYPYLTPRYRLSLDIIYNLYSQIYERIDIENGNFTASELNPTPEEVQKRVDSTISTFKSR